MLRDFALWLRRGRRCMHPVVVRGASTTRGGRPVSGAPRLWAGGYRLIRPCSG